jgi:hypothetical protein
MFVAKFRSIGEAAIEAGNSEGIMRRHYPDLKSAEEAEDYWSILLQRAIWEVTPARDSVGSGVSRCAAR